MDFYGYTVYKNGDIMRKDGKGMLKPRKNNKGYLQVSICIDKKDIRYVSPSFSSIMLYS